MVAAKPSPLRHQPTHPVAPGDQYKEMPVADPWPSGPFDIASELPLAIGTGPSGTTHRVIRAIADPGRRWAVVCQQRHDSDRDGTIEYEMTHHFTIGDRPYAYFAVGGGPGSEIDEVVAVSRNGNHLVLRIDHATILFDLITRTGMVLPGAQTTADFTPDGRFLVYVDETEGKSQVIQRDLTTGFTKAVPYPTGTGAVIAGTTGRWALISPYGDLRSHHEWCAFGGSDEPSLDDRVFVDLEKGAIASDPAIVWPLGDRMLTRTKNTLAMNGAPFGPTDCKELEVLAVHEATGGVLVLCTRADQSSKRRRTVHYLNDTLALEFDGGWAERNFDPVPERITGTDTCFRFQGMAMCIDVTTGAHTKKPWPELNRAGFEEDGQEHAVAGDFVLLGSRDGNGPLRWVPQVRDKKVAP